MSEKHLYIDFSHICHRNLFALAPDIKSMGFAIFRHGIVKSVILLIEKFEPNKVFICCDASRNWRKKYFEPYKAHRKEARDKFDIDWEQFYATIEEVIVGFRSNFPFYVMQQDWLEADDLVAYLTRKHPNDEKILVSSDSDFVQLLRYPNTKIYCPVKQQFIECDNPLFFLERKIVMGDKNSDNIPSIAPRVGPKTAETLIADGIIDNILNDIPLSEEYSKYNVKEMKENYKRNSKLIDLTKTPGALIDILDKEIENIKPAHSRGVRDFIVKYKMKDMFYRMHQINATMVKLNPPNVTEGLSPLAQ